LHQAPVTARRRSPVLAQLLTQLATGTDVLGLARAVLDDPTSPYTEVRYAGIRLAECLTDALRVAESRGLRLSVSDFEDDDGAEAAEANAEAGRGMSA
jgi:hypothetical protein